MKPYNKPALHTLQATNKPIEVFTALDSSENIDAHVVSDFGEEWKKFAVHTDETVRELRKEYFDIIDETIVNKDTYMIDIGCGSGRWTDYFVDKAAFIEAIDPSDAVLVADRMLGNKSNVRITKASVDTIPWDDETFDFGMSIGVLHHIPDTRKALESCVKKIKKGGHFYVYLYYRFDNRGFLFKTIFYLSDLLRLIISRMPAGLKRFTCDVLAVVIYWPLSRFAGLLHKMNLHRLAKKIPLEPYHNKPFYNLRNDCLDRFGTKLEQRFLRSEIEAMMTGAGLTDIRFGEQSAFWHAVGKRS
ncbi:MAG: class I SAM-dependent methyltransferase [Chitinophagaceae bacterium]|nr:class I SAM-dependent methyltransferase [Chitinophagaceae bacterium]